MTASTPLRITVLAGLGRNPVSGVARANRDDVLALEIGRQLGATMTLLHAGDGAGEALADYLAFGAPGVEIVPLADGQDVAEALAGRIGECELVLTGSRAEGGEGSGLVPYLVAEHLGLPIVAQALAVEIADGFAEVVQFLPKGQRRKVRVSLPAVIAVHPMADASPRYAHARRIAGRIVRQPPVAAGLAEPGLWRSEPAGKTPVRLRAAETRAGHARMVAAIVAEAKGGVVMASGTPAEQAQAILGYLREHRLIEW